MTNAWSKTEVEIEADVDDDDRANDKRGRVGKIRYKIDKSKINLYRGRSRRYPPRRRSGEGSDHVNCLKVG